MNCIADSKEDYQWDLRSERVKWQYYVRQRSFVYVAFIFDTRPPNVRLGTKNAGRRSRMTDAKTVCTRYIWVHMYLDFTCLTQLTCRTQQLTNIVKRKFHRRPHLLSAAFFITFDQAFFFVFSPQPQAFRTRKPPDRKLRFLNRLFFKILLSWFFYFLFSWY